MTKHFVYLSIGGNLGEREANLEETRLFIEFNMGSIVSESSIYESEAWAMEDAAPFLNQIVKIETELTPEELLLEIKELEEFYGRERVDGVYQSREMDIDIIFFDELILETAALNVPHPRMQLRKFVLLPLAEIAPDFIHPTLKKDIATLLVDCKDLSRIAKI